MIFDKFHKPTTNLVVPGSLYLMLLLAFAMIFFSFQPVQEAEAGPVAVVGLIIICIALLFVKGHNEPAKKSSSSLPLVPEFIEVVRKESFLS